MANIKEGGSRGKPDGKFTWEKAMGLDELPEGRVKPVTCRHLTVCMTYYQGSYAALDNK